jgi:integrase
VPLSQGTTDVLSRYRELRGTVALPGLDEAFFVSGRGKAYSTSCVGQVFRDISVQVGLRGPTGRGPRLHDLRATFAVTRLLQWYRDGENVMSRLPLLSTYLGHARVSDTEVYLRITTALLQQANTRFHAFVRDILPSGGES